jgi:hypothetical protein
VADVAALEARAARERRHVCDCVCGVRERECVGVGVSGSGSERSAATVSVRSTAHRVDDSSGASRAGMLPGVLRPRRGATKRRPGGASARRARRRDGRHGGRGAEGVAYLLRGLLRVPWGSCACARRQSVGRIFEAIEGHTSAEEHAPPTYVQTRASRPSRDTASTFLRKREMGVGGVVGEHRLTAGRRVARCRLSPAARRATQFWLFRGSRSSRGPEPR